MSGGEGSGMKIFFELSEEERLKQDMARDRFPFTTLTKEIHFTGGQLLYAVCEMLTGSDLKYLNNFMVVKIVERA